MKNSNLAGLILVLILFTLGGCSEDPPATAPAAPTPPPAPSSSQGSDDQDEATGDKNTQKTNTTAENATGTLPQPKNQPTTSPVTDEVKKATPEDRATKIKRAQSEREQRIKEVYSLIRKGDEASIQQLVGIARGNEQLGIRATAVRVLGQKKREDLIPMFKSFLETDQTMVQLEAAIVLYKWGEQKVALPILEKYSERGVALRRAFMTGRKNGKGMYDKNAKKFLKKGLASGNILTQLDAAVGLYELGSQKQAIKVFRTAMEGDHPHHVRIAALNYLRHLKDDPKVRSVIQIATSDSDDRVKSRANDILSQAPRN